MLVGQEAGSIHVVCAEYYPPCGSEIWLTHKLLQLPPKQTVHVAWWLVVPKRNPVNLKRSFKKKKYPEKWAVRTVQGTEASGYSLPLFLYGLLIAYVARHSSYACRLQQPLIQGAVGQSAISFKVRDVQFAQLQSASPVHGSMGCPMTCYQWGRAGCKALAAIFVSDI